MKALIYKDYVTGKSGYLLSFVLVCWITYTGIQNGVLVLGPLSLCYLPIIMSFISFGQDARCHLKSFLFATPVSRRDYVFSKYLLPICINLVSAVILAVLLCLKSDLPVMWVALSSVSLLAAAVIFLSVQLPFVFRFGTDKGRLMVVLTYLIFFGLVSLLKSSTGKVKELFLQILASGNSSRFTLIALALILIITLAALFVSVRVSLKIMEKRENR